MSWIHVSDSEIKSGVKPVKKKKIKVQRKVKK